MIQKRLLQMAVLYFIAGISVGLYMGITTTFTLTPVHAHLNLLGWVSMAVIALIYKAYPEAMVTTLAKAHFWLHSIFLPVSMVLLALMLLGNQALGPAVGITSILMGLGIVAFCVTLLRFIR